MVKWVFRDPEGSLEITVLQAQPVLTVPEGRMVSWASRDPRETWVHLDHLWVTVLTTNRTTSLPGVPWPKADSHICHYQEGRPWFFHLSSYYYLIRDSLAWMRPQEWQTGAWIPNVPPYRGQCYLFCGRVLLWEPTVNTSSFGCVCFTVSIQRNILLLLSILVVVVFDVGRTASRPWLHLHTTLNAIIFIFLN